MASSILLEARSYRPFKSSEEYLDAMKEDLAEWLNTLYPELELNVDNFMEKLETGVVLCKHANNVRKQAEDYLARKHLRKGLSSMSLTQSVLSQTAIPIVGMGDCSYKSGAKSGTFFARDNVSNFIDFARKGLEILECLLFETEDLIMRKNEKNVILCLLEVARRGAKYGMIAPTLVQMEREIDKELALDRGEVAEDTSEDEDAPKKSAPIPQIVTNDLKSLDEMVRDLLEQCTCPTQFPMIRVSEGKYRIGDTKVLIFVRILRTHVMVRVGGGWDTLSHYLDKHDPCRCRAAHRTATSAKLVTKHPQPYDLSHASVHYDRSRRSSASSSSSTPAGEDVVDSPYMHNRSRSPTPRPDVKYNLQPPKYGSSSSSAPEGEDVVDSPYVRNRSRSPTPRPDGKYNLQPPKYGSSSSSAPAGEDVVDSPYVRNRSRSPTPRLDGKFNLQPPKYVSTYQFNTTRHRSASPNPLVMARRSCSPAAPHRRSSDDGKSSRGRSRSPGVCTLQPNMGPRGRSKSPASLGLHPSGDIKHSRSPGYDSPTASSRNRSRSPSVREQIKPDDDSLATELADFEKYASISGSCSEIYDSRRASREGSLASSARSSPERSRRSSLMNETTSSQRRSSLTRSRSASSGDNTMDTTPVRRISGDKCGTWSGKPKGKRSALTTETFQRGSAGRSSLGSRKLEYDPQTGRRLQKSVSPLVSDVIQLKDIEDDKIILQKMKELISQYSDILESNDDSRLCDDERNAHRRKDSKYEKPQSKIPAPVFYQPASTEKEC